MRMFDKKFFVLFVFFITNVVYCYSEWRVGLQGSANNNFYSRESGYAYDRCYDAKFGGGGGVVTCYNFKDWLGLRLDIQIMQRNYTQRNLVCKERFDYKHLYCIVPLMVSFSFGGKAVRGYCDIGGYIGGWLSGTNKYLMMRLSPSDDISYIEGTEKYTFDSRRDNRFDAGLSGAVGIRYTHPKTRIYVNMEFFAYYGLVSSHKSTSQFFKQPAYNSNIGIGLGVGYVFKQRNAKQNSNNVLNSQI